MIMLQVQVVFSIIYQKCCILFIIVPQNSLRNKLFWKWTGWFLTKSLNLLMPVQLDRNISNKISLYSPAGIINSYGWPAFTCRIICRPACCDAAL